MKETIQDSTSLKRELKKRFEELSQVDALVMDYREKREKYLGTLKKVAIYGVIRGALKYLDVLLECSSPDVV